MIPIVDVQALTVVAGTQQKPILRAVDLTLDGETALGIVGESGSGKTTLALALMGHCKSGLAPAAGTVRLAGQDVFALARPALSRLRSRTAAYVPQNAGTSLTPTRAVGPLIEEMLAHCGVRGRRARRARSLALLAEIGLTPAETYWTRHPHRLSGGQQQRCALALALAGTPSVLILDEPTSGLDTATTRTLVAHLQQIRRARRLAIVCISHDIRLVAALCDRAVVMYRGEVVEACASERLLTRPRHPYAQALVDAVPRTDRGAGAPVAADGAAPIGRSPGCSFAPNCRFRIDACATQRPALTAVSTRDRVRCIRHPVPAMAAAPSAATDRGGRATGHPTLIVDGLTVGYDQPSVLRRAFGTGERRFAVADVSIQVRAASIFGIAGRSGSGKSTLLRALSGLLRPERGRAQLDGAHDLTLPAGKRPLAVARRVQMIWQNPLKALNPRATVLEALAGPLRLYFRLDGAALMHRAAALLDAVRLPAGFLARYPGQLSGGEAQRVAIARACAAEPAIFLCDEITSALDLSVQAAILALVEDLRARTGAAFLFVSHDLDVLRSLADDLAVFEQGRVVEQGPAARVLNRPDHPHTRDLLAARLTPAVHDPQRADAHL